MAVEIVTMTWCDPCLVEHDARTTARTFEIVLDGGKPRTIELCEAHELEILKPLRDLLARFGRRIQAPPRAPRVSAPAVGEPAARSGRAGRAPASGERPLVCIACDATYAARGGYAAHLTSAHGAPKTATISAAYGGRCPLCGYTGEPAGLGAHTGSIHRLGVAQAFTEAREAGDPFGIVAERAEILRAAA